MKLFSLSSFLFFTIVFSWNTVAQDMGSLQKNYNFSVPEKIQGPLGDPLPAGTYSIGSGGDFPTIDSAFNKLSIDGIAGGVTMELIDSFYTAPADTFGFLMIGPIAGAGENSRVKIKPAQNHQVTIEGDGGGVLSFFNTSYVTLDGVTLAGSTTLAINSYNSNYTFKCGINFIDDSDHNIVKNLQVNCEDYTNYGIAIGFWTNLVGATGAPDSNLIESNKISKACAAIYVSAYYANVYGSYNIIRDNLISAPAGNVIRWGIQFEKNENTIAENNVVENLMNSESNLEAAIGINAHWCNSCTIRNNVVSSISSNIRNGSTGIMLSGVPGKEGYDNEIYNNMVFDIQSNSANTSSRVAGIQTWQNHNPKIYYNSINLSGTGSNYMGSGALYIRTNTTNMEAYDNIFVNTRDESPHCASSIYIWAYPTILTSDYNDLYYQPNPNSCLVRATGGDYLNLEEWQATGHDMHGISEMPNFIALDNLHIDESIPTNLESGATPIAGIDKDFDGDSRHASTPDIGADEFDGTSLSDTLHVPSEYSTIQAAIDAATDGDVVLVAEGTYYENINYKGKAITVASHFLVSGDSTHIENTIIDGSQPSHPDSGSVVYFISGEDTNSVLCGFTITNGTGTITYSPFEYGGGGGIYCANSGARIEHNKIIDNSVNYTTEAIGGGISVDGSDIVYLIIKENQIMNNNISSDGPTFGGGMGLINCSGIIIDNIVSQNTCVSSAAQGNSGGIGCWSNLPDTPFVMIKDNQISFNTAIGVDVGTNSGAGSGGLGIFVCQGIIQGNKITNNVVKGSQDAYGAGLGCGDVHENILIDGNYIANNSVKQGTGWGGGISIFRASSTITNNIIINNSAIYNSGGYGGGIEIVKQSSSDILNNTISGNKAGYGGGIYSRNSDVIIMNTIFWGDSSTIGNQEIDWSGGSFEVVYSDVQGGWTGEGNINSDPLFSDTLYRLSDNSPCLQAGIDSIEIVGTMHYCPPLCFHGIQRPSPIGTTPDIGACENPNLPPSVEHDLTFIPDDFGLFQNYPNPFNPNTTIKYGMPERTFVELRVYDILGIEVETLVNKEQEAGYHEIDFDATKLSSGIYLYRLKAGDFIQTKKMILLK